MSSVQPRRGITRRELLGIGIAGGLAALYPVGRLAGVFGKRPDLIEEMERRACLYFWEQAHPDTGRELGLFLLTTISDTSAVIGVAGVVLSVYLGLRYSMVRFAVLDDAGVAGSLRRSAHLTLGAKGRLLFFFIVLGALNMLGAIALGIGLLITLPVSMLAYAHVYLKLKSSH